MKQLIILGAALSLLFSVAVFSDVSQNEAKVNQLPPALKHIYIVASSEAEQQQKHNAQQAYAEQFPELLKKGLVPAKGGLMWMRCSLGQTWTGVTCKGEVKNYERQEAIGVAKAKEFSDYSDWRLPTLQELDSLVYCSKGRTPIVINREGRPLGKTVDEYEIGGCLKDEYQEPTLNQALFPNTYSGFYWSSSAIVNYSSDHAWGVYFHFGANFISGQSNSGNRVRLVRSEPNEVKANQLPPAPKNISIVASSAAEQQQKHNAQQAYAEQYPELLKKGLVPTKGGLMWMRCSLGQTWTGITCEGEAKEYNWNQAIETAKAKEFSGYSDWRLPSLQELSNLVYCSEGREALVIDRGMTGKAGHCLKWSQHPSLNQVLFPNINSENYNGWWSSSISGYTSSAAWDVSFLGGSQHIYGLEQDFRVRLVRGGQYDAQANQLLPAPKNISTATSSVAEQQKKHSAQQAYAEQFPELLKKGLVPTKNGLVWMRCSLGQTWTGSSCKGEAKEYKWDQAIETAKAKEFSGYSDWRLPTLQELDSLVYCSKGREAIVIKSGGEWTPKYGSCLMKGGQKPTLNQVLFPNTVSKFYWSSSPSAIDRDDTWGVNFYIGVGYDVNRLYGHRVRLVRGEQNKAKASQLPPAPKNISIAASSVAEQQQKHNAQQAYAEQYLELLKKGLVPTKDGLMWMRCSLGQIWIGSTCEREAKKYNWDQAIERAKTKEFSGYSDWRLPTLQELNSLVYCSKGREAIVITSDGEWTPKYGSCLNKGDQEPVLNQVLFPNTASKFYWSSSLSASSSSNAWGVYFSNGSGLNHYRFYFSRVRLVRVGQ